MHHRPPTSQRRLDRIRAAIDNRRQRHAFRAALRRIATEWS